MGTFVAFLVAVAAATAIAVFLRRTPAASRGLALVGNLVARPLLWLCRLASAIVDFFLRPQGSGRHIAPGRYALWVAAALVPMLAFFAIVAWPLPLPKAANPGFLLILGALFPVLSILAAYVIVHDDFDVMDGVVDSVDRRLGGARSATRPSTIALSLALFAAYAIAIAYWLSAVDGLALFDKRPFTGFAGIDYVLIGLRALPTDYVLTLLDRFTGDDTAVLFSGTLAAQAYYFIFMAIGSLLIVGVAAIAVQQAWQLRRIVTEIGESDARREFLTQRATLAPPGIRNGILRAAVTRRPVDRQKRLIVAAKEIGIFSLPQEFCRAVESLDSEVQTFGLEQCLEMFRHRSREFEAEQCERTLAEGANVLRRGKLGAEPAKKLLRLMTSVVVVKRGAIRIPDALRAALEATIRVELDKPRAKEDPALRGFFRDLQSALNGAPAGLRPPVTERREEARVRKLPIADVVNLPAIVVEEAAPSPEPEDPAAPPDSPAPTVH